MSAPDQEEDLTAGPLADRVVSTKWKVRQLAYKELLKLFTEAEEDSHPVFQQYGTIPPLKASLPPKYSPKRSRQH